MSVLRVPKQTDEEIIKDAAKTPGKCLFEPHRGISDLPLQTRLIQFAEECAEASQAALKLVRAMDGDTPVPEHRAAVNLLEEIADVYVTALALDPDPMTIEAIARKKTKRWEERINEP